MGKRWLGLGGAWLAALVLAIMGTTPPQQIATPSGAPGEASAARAFGVVEAIAREPHPTGSAANARVRDYLVGELTRMGLTVETTSGVLDQRAQVRLDRWAKGTAPGPTRFVNVIGVLPGRDRTLPAVALMAHYDSVWGSPGAADDSAGVASVLETVRAIAARGAPARDLVVILTDGEELGLVGARDFFARSPLAGRIGAVINLEARGGGGIASMFQTSPGNGAVAAFYARTVSHPATSSLAAFLYSVLPNDTDLTETLHRGGYAAWNIAFIGRPALYHSPLATPANLDRGALNHMLGQTHELATALLAAPDLPKAGADAVFFDLFGLLVIVFPPWLGWAMLALAAIGYATSWRRERTPPGTILAGIGSGALRMTGLMVGAALALAVLNWLSGDGADADYYDRLAAIPKLIGMACFALAAAAIALWGRRAAGFGMRLGAALPLALLAIAAQALAPTAAYFLVIPVMLAGLVEAARSHGGHALGTVAAAIVTALVTGYMLALGYQMMQGVGPGMPWVVALPAALAVLGWLPLWEPLPRARALAGAMLFAALMMALWVRFDPVPPSVAVYASVQPG